MDDTAIPAIAPGFIINLLFLDAERRQEFNIIIWSVFNQAYT